MTENKSYCPLCNSAFTPADGVLTDEHLARTIISIYEKIQTQAEYEDCTDNPIPCPRCGHTRMSPKVSRNALSRHAAIQVCDICGVDEAVRVFSDSVLPLSCWWLTQQLLPFNRTHS